MRWPLPNVEHWLLEALRRPADTAPLSLRSSIDVDTRSVPICAPRGGLRTSLFRFEGTACVPSRGATPWDHWAFPVIERHGVASRLRAARRQRDNRRPARRSAL